MNIGFEAKRAYHNKTGLGNYSRDLIKILTTFFPENQYFLFNPKKSKEKLFKISSNNIKERLPSSLFNKKFYNIWRQKRIIHDLEKDNISIFHGLSGELPSGLKKKNIRSVVTIHDLIFIRYPHLYSLFDRKIHFYKFKKAAQQADIVIAISEQTKKDIIEFLKIPSSKIKVIYQGCQDIFKQSFTFLEKQKIRNKYNLPHDFILNVGTVEERKNALTIVKAIKKIDTTLVLIGRETDYSKRIKKYILENQMEKKVMFLKNVTNQELAIIYQLASIFIYPSVFEGFGIPIIEALFSKVPVITNKNGVFPEAAGHHSLYIDPFDSKDLSEKIDFLLKNPTLRNEIAQKGYEYVQKFNDEKIAKKLINVYREVLCM